MARMTGRFLIAVLLLLVSLVLGQSSEPTPTPTPSDVSLSVSLSFSTRSFTTSSRSEGSLVPVPTFSVASFNVTHTIASATVSATESVSATPEPITLDTKIDPAFAVLGALLILTGIPMAFWGHKNRWTSFFLSGFFTLALVCFVLILKFGILPAVKPPSKTLRGMFVLASFVAGVAGGGVAIFFWKGAKFFIGAWGGLAVGLFIQCLRNGGLIQPIGYRWILFIGCAVAGFILCTINKLHYHILLVSTAFVGATAFMLGVDCYTTAGLKEFYVWNIGFKALFPKFTENGIRFPVSQTMQIELGLMGAVALMGIAVQFRVLRVLQRKLAEIQEEQRRRDEEADMVHNERFAAVLREKEEWEKEHPTLVKHGRHESDISNVALMKDQDTSEQSGVSSLDEARKAGARSQSPGALPALDLGQDIEQNVKGMMSEDSDFKDVEPKDKEKLSILQEIQDIRKSIEVLKGDSPGPSNGSGSRHPSFSSRRTLSIGGLTNGTAPSHLRPPRSTDPRGRVQSMELSALAPETIGDKIGRPTSAPLRDDWDVYLHDRKLIQPPSGVSAPIPTSPLPPATVQKTSKIHMPQAVNAAITRRKEMEKVLLNPSAENSSEDVPIAASQSRHRKSRSTGNNVPVNILPPRKPSPVLAAPAPQRPVTRTFEELNERHREKMRDLQRPITQKEEESAQLAAAKQRWERSMALEKEATLKRQAEKAAQLEREQRRSQDEAPQQSKHSRSLSADKLAAMGGTGPTSKRVSALKVQDWQRHQMGGVDENGRRTTDPIRSPTKDSSRRQSRRESADRVNRQNM